RRAGLPPSAPENVTRARQPRQVPQTCEPYRLAAFFPQGCCRITAPIRHPYYNPSTNFTTRLYRHAQTTAHYAFFVLNRCTSSPTIPRRKAMTQIMKIRPITIVTDSPRICTHCTPVAWLPKRPNSPTLFSSKTTIKAPSTGPTKVPSPPISVIKMTMPDICQVASDNVAETNTRALVEPARPA